VSPRILILDDDDSILALLKRYFDGLGWQVEAFTEAPEGLGPVESDSFDAVICDLHFGPHHQGEGLSVINRVRETHPDAAVLLFTAATGDGVRAAALEAGADEVISKPAPLAHLRDATVRAMKKR